MRSVWKEGDEVVSEEEKKKLDRSYLAMMAVFVLLGAACGILIVSVLDRRDLTGGRGREWLWLLALLLWMYAAMLVQIVLHEAGHLIGGLLTGYRFSSFRVGCVMLSRENGTLRLRRYSLAGTGGQCLMLPPEKKDGKMPYILYNLGGPLMNLFVGAVFAWLAALLWDAPLAGALCAIMAVVGIAFALINGLPLRLGGLDNDGRNARSLGRDPAALRAFCIQMELNGALTAGARLRDLPEEWFAAPPVEQMGSALTASMGAQACSRLMDERRFEEADAQMERLLAGKTGLIGLHRSQLLCDRLFCALLRGDGMAADALYDKALKKFMKSMRANPSILRTQYALALLRDGDTVAAERLRKQFERAARRYPYQDDAQSERELIELVAHAAQEGSTA